MIDKSLDELKTLADSLGVQYHPSIGKEKLIEKIEAAAGTPEAEPEAAEAKEEVTPEELRKQAKRLVRVRVNNMNPAKREWEGEIFTVGNKLIGNVKRYVPYGVEWHIEKCIFDMLKSKKCQIFTTVKRKTGNGTVDVRQGKLINEFAIEELPPLTEAELKDLAQRQAMARGTAEA